MKKLIPLSVTQKLIWFDSKVSKDQSRFNVGGYVVLKGKIDVDLLERSVQHMLNDNEIFQCDLVENDGVPFMHFPHSDMRSVMVKDCSTDSAGTKVLNWIENDITRPLDVERNEFFVARIFRTSENEVIWYIKVHHLLVDGYAFKLIFKKVAQCYNQLRIGGQIDGNKYPYEAFIDEEIEYRSSAVYEADKAYWMKKFLSLPELTCVSGPVVRHEQNISMSRVIERRKYNQLKQLSESAKASTFHLFLALLFITLRKTFNKGDLAIAIPILNRVKASYKQTIGVFMNMIPIRQEVSAKDTLAGLCAKIRDELKRSYKHQRFQMGDLLHELRHVDRSIERLYDLRFSFEHFTYDSGFDECKSSIVVSTHSDERDPISIYLREYDETEDVVIDVKINRQYMNESLAERFTKFFEKATDECIQYFDQPLGAWNLYDQSEVSRILASLSQGEIKERSGNVIDLLERCAKAFGKRTAIICDGAKISYAELMDLSGKIASRIISLENAGISKMIPLLATRDHHMLIGMIGILRSGHAFVPIDATTPPARLRLICDDLGSQFILTTTEFLDVVGEVGASPLVIEEILQRGDAKTRLSAIDETDTAYVIYTSGSTGTPKGVAISHLSLLDYSQTFGEYFNVTQNDVITQQASISFDASIEEIFPALIHGSAILVIKDNKDFKLILENITSAGATILSTNPFLVDFISNSSDVPPSLRIIISGGDTLRPEFVGKLLSKVALFNTYGPTESTVCATYFRVPNEGSIRNPIPIGLPITNRNVYLLDDNLQQVPFDTEGEICITGAGLSKGYVNDKVKSDVRFVACPYEPGKVMFRTGDMAKYNRDGQLEFIGRKDGQVKVSGYRVELSEIETVLSRHAAVRQCKVITANEDLLKTIVGYVVSTQPGENLQQLLKEHCEAFLPEYMIPRAFVVLDRFPLTANGKIDISRLPQVKVSSTTERVLPRNEKEESIAVLWRKLLCVDEVGVNENFFDIGGNSIRANSFTARLHQALGIDMSLKDFFNNPYISEVAKIEPDAAIGRTTLSKAPRNGRIPLTFEQERLWFLNKLNPSNNSYIVPRAIRIKGQLRLDLLERALNAVIERHEILRTEFHEDDGVLVQRILPARKIPIEFIDFTDLSPDERRAREKAIGVDEGNKPFDLSKDHLQRVTFIKSGDDQALVIWCQHHLVHDGWTQGVFINEFMTNYSAFLNNAPPELPPLPFQYGDYAAWQRGYFMETVVEKHISYWTQKLEGMPHVIELPLDRPRPKNLTGRGSIERMIVSAELADEARAFSKAHGVTLYMTMLATFRILLGRFSGMDDFCVGGWFANRRLSEIENMIGMIINTIPLRTPISSDDNFKSYLMKVRDTVIEAMEHQDTPFDKIVDELHVERDLSYLPLVQVGFAFMDTPTRRLQLPGVELIVEGLHNHSAKLDIGIIVITPREQLQDDGDVDHDIVIELEYNADIFKKTTIRRLLDWYEILLKECIKSSNRLADISLLSESDIRLFDSAHSDFVAASTDDSLVRLFESNVEKSPSITAVKFGPFDFSYRYINGRANALARILRRKGISRGERVGIMLRRSEQMIIGILAVLKTGGVFVPMDVAAPLERLRYIIDDSQQTALITDIEVHAEFGDVAIVHPEAVAGNVKEEDMVNLGSADGAYDPIYVMYTSGSTGMPKGVLVRSASLFNQFRAVASVVGDVPKVLASSAITFDPSLIELLMPITAGATVVLTPSHLSIDTAAMIGLIERENPLFLQGTPTFWKNLIDNGWKGNKQATIFCGGEPLVEELAAALLERSATLYNVYGPTETTVWSTYQRITNPGDSKRVGRPFANVEVSILDSNFRQLPAGIAGQICIAGEGVAIEYVNKPALTSASFVDNPLKPGTRMYLSGDVGRWTDDGTIEFFGRKDNQLKIHGHRIEPGEIENTMLRHAGIKQAVVVGIVDAGEKTLCAYYTSDEELSATDLRSFLQSALPVQMIPAYFVRLEEFPLTTSLKIDRRALPLPGKNNVRRNGVKKAETKVQQNLASIWSEILRREDIGVNDTFFELGGNSLKLIALYNQISKMYPNRVQVHDLFTYPTIYRLSEFLESRPADNISAFEVIEL